MFGRKLGRRVLYFLLVNFLLLKDRILIAKFAKGLGRVFVFYLFIVFQGGSVVLHRGTRLTTRLDTTVF